MFRRCKFVDVKCCQPRPTTVACLSDSASSFVYHAMGVMHHVARVRLQQVRFASTVRGTCETASARVKLVS